MTVQDLLRATLRTTPAFDPPPRAREVRGPLHQLLLSLGRSTPAFGDGPAPGSRPRDALDSPANLARIGSLAASARTVLARHGEDDPHGLTRRDAAFKEASKTVLVNAIRQVGQLLRQADRDWGTLPNAQTPVRLLAAGEVTRFAVLVAHVMPLARLADSDLSNAHLVAADLRRSTMDRANLREAQLQGAQLASVNMAEADLRAARLNSADLMEANLMSARLSGADLTSSNLHRATLNYADLASARLRDANLRDTDFAGANLRDVDMSGATGLTLHRLRGARWDTSTRWPDGLGDEVLRRSHQTGPGQFRVSGYAGDPERSPVGSRL
jgi:uncharacterized protein YjbI with pentapeptide repeats